MEKFKKLPIQIEAVQFTDKNKDQVYAWASQVQQNVFHDWDENKQPILKIPTLEGEMICAIGDYLIKEPFPTDWRKLYPCKASIFEQTYEALQNYSIPDFIGSVPIDKKWDKITWQYVEDCKKNGWDGNRTDILMNWLVNNYHSPEERHDAGA